MFSKGHSRTKGSFTNFTTDVHHWLGSGTNSRSSAFLGILFWEVVWLFGKVRASFKFISAMASFLNKGLEVTHCFRPQNLLLLSSLVQFCWIISRPSYTDIPEVTHCQTLHSCPQV
jgi:hypothetical protein